MREAGFKNRDDGLFPVEQPFEHIVREDSLLPNGNEAGGWEVLIARLIRFPLGGLRKAVRPTSWGDFEDVVVRLPP